MASLPIVPDELSQTRVALHRLATYVIAPARYRVTERFGLRATAGGFGTPEFGGRRIRVEGIEIVDESDGSARRAPITSLAAASTFLGAPIDETTAAEHDSPPLGDVDEDLGINLEASRWLGEWFRVAFEALTIVRGDEESVDGSEPQLWPGHFDPAIEVGDEDHRASYGASPGDHAITEPYLYVSAWWPDRLTLVRSDEQWNAPGFVGRVLPVSEFVAVDDPVATAVDFWRDGRDRLARY